MLRILLIVAFSLPLALAWGAAGVGASPSAQTDPRPPHPLFFGGGTAYSAFVAVQDDIDGDGRVRENARRDYRIHYRRLGQDRPAGRACANPGPCRVAPGRGEWTVWATSGSGDPAGPNVWAGDGCCVGPDWGIRFDSDPPGRSPRPTATPTPTPPHKANPPAPTPRPVSFTARSPWPTLSPELAATLREPTPTPGSPSAPGVVEASATSDADDGGLTPLWLFPLAALLVLAALWLLWRERKRARRF